MKTITRTLRQRGGRCAERGERHLERTAWVRARLGQVLTGQATAVVADLEQAGQKATLFLA